jgi:hypothetical protein
MVSGFDSLMTMGTPNDPWDAWSKQQDPVTLAQGVGGGAASLGLPSWENAYQQEALRLAQDPAYLQLRTMFDENFRRMMRYKAGKIFKQRHSAGEYDWWVNPRDEQRAIQQQLMNNRAAQQEFFGDGSQLYEDAKARAMRTLEARRAAGLASGLYGDQFTRTAEPGQGAPPGYRIYTDQFGNQFMIDGRTGRIIRGGPRGTGGFPSMPNGFFGF